MRIAFGLIGLLVALFIVGKLTSQSASTLSGPAAQETAAPAGARSGTTREQARQVRQQVIHQYDQAMQQAQQQRDAAMRADE